MLSDFSLCCDVFRLKNHQGNCKQKLIQATLNSYRSVISRTITPNRNCKYLRRLFYRLEIPSHFLLTVTQILKTWFLKPNLYKFEKINKFDWYQKNCHRTSLVIKIVISHVKRDISIKLFHTVKNWTEMFKIRYQVNFPMILLK